jgi:hypothetical protein
MISDPFTLEIGEIRNSAVQAGFEKEGLSGGVYVFNGEVDEDSDDDIIMCYGINLGYAFGNEDVSIEMQVGYVNNILGSGGFLRRHQY